MITPLSILATTVSGLAALPWHSASLQTTRPPAQEAPIRGLGSGRTPVLAFYAVDAKSLLDEALQAKTEDAMRTAAEKAKCDVVRGKTCWYLFHRPSLGLEAARVARLVLSEMLNKGLRAGTSEIDLDGFSPEAKEAMDSLLDWNSDYRDFAKPGNLKPFLVPMAQVTLKNGDRRVSSNWLAQTKRPEGQDTVPYRDGPPTSKPTKPKSALDYSSRALNGMAVAFAWTGVGLPKRSQWVVEGATILEKQAAESFSAMDSLEKALIAKLFQQADDGYTTDMFTLGTTASSLRADLAHSVTGYVEGSWKGLGFSSQAEAANFANGASIEKVSWNVQVEFYWTDSRGNSSRMSFPLTP